MRALAALASAALVLSGSRTVRAEPCPPRASLDGDGAAVERVGEELRRLGVTVSSDRVSSDGVTSDGDRAPSDRVSSDRATSDRVSNDRASDEVRAMRETRDSRGVDADGCTTVRAQVQLEANGGIAVAVRGATRGSEGRIVSDAVLAAAWIDSWTRQDVDVALWAAPARRTALVAPTGHQPPHDVAPTATTAVAAPTSRWDRVAFSASYEQTWSDDDTAWRGANVSACIRVAGGFCVGGALRTAFDPERLYNATGVGRSDLSVLALARYPVAIGTMSIAPELGVGVGRLATRRAESSCEGEKMPPPNCDPMTDPMCVPEPPTMCDPNNPAGTMTTKVYVGDNFEAVTHAPRIALALRVAVPLFEHVWLDGLVGWTYTPFAHGSVFKAEPMVNPLVEPEAIALPGEPSSGYSIAIGLRVGGR